MFSANKRRKIITFLHNIGSCKWNNEAASLAILSIIRQTSSRWNIELGSQLISDKYCTYTKIKMEVIIESRTKLDQNCDAKQYIT